MSDRLLTRGGIFTSGREPQSAWFREQGLALLRSLQTALRRQRSRGRLVELDAHALKDIGVTFADAEAEANKPFWRM